MGVREQTKGKGEIESRREREKRRSIESNVRERYLHNTRITLKQKKKTEKNTLGIIRSSYDVKVHKIFHTVIVLYRHVSA